MPKVYDTRRHKAKALLDRLTRGPSFSSAPGEDLWEGEAARQFRNWSESWVLPVLKELVPELREKKL